MKKRGEGTVKRREKEEIEIDYVSIRHNATAAVLIIHG